MISRQSVCYIVPYFSADAAEHFAHIPRFLSELGQYCDVHAVFLRGEGNPSFPNVASIHILKSATHQGRIWELIHLARNLRNNGCRKFFVRISASAAFALGLFSRFADIQVYYWNSGDILEVEKPWWQDPKRWLMTMQGKAIVHLNIKLAHKLVTGPESMVDYYVRWFGIKRRDVVVLYNDVDVRCIDELRCSCTKSEARSYLGLPQDIPIVFSVGRVSYLKGGQHIVPIARSLAERCNALLIIAGQLEYLPKVVLAAQDLSNLQLLGAVPNRELYRYFIAADIFILRSESEGFSRSLLEAMAYSLPIAAFDVGGVRDIVDSRQFIFLAPKRNVEALVGCISSLLEHPALSVQQAQISHERAHMFSTERVAYMFYERIVCD